MCVVRRYGDVNVELLEICNSGSWEVIILFRRWLCVVRGYGYVNVELLVGNMLLWV